MQTRQINIWTLLGTHQICIPTNIGWRKDGTNVMGTGLAFQAAQKYPALALWYGRRCQDMGSDVGLQYYETGKLILFPTKPLHTGAPWLSWQGMSSPSLIEKGLKQLVAFSNDRDRTPVALPMLGCGAGGLSTKIVLKLLERYLHEDRFVLCTGVPA